jgi:hypothetical protein
MHAIFLYLIGTAGEQVRLVPKLKVASSVRSGRSQRKFQFWIEQGSLVIKFAQP